MARVKSESIKILKGQKIMNLIYCDDQVPFVTSADN